MQILSIKNRKSDIFLALLLTVFIISLAVVITVFFKPLYYFDIDYLHISETTGLSVDVIRHNYDVLIQYQSLFYQGTLNLPDFVMSNSGRIHFEEVKRIFEIIQITCFVSGLWSLIMVYRRLKQKEYRFMFVRADGEQLRKITKIVEDKNIKPKIYSTVFNMDNASEALRTVLKNIQTEK